MQTESDGDGVLPADRRPQTDSGSLYHGALDASSIVSLIVPFLRLVAIRVQLPNISHSSKQNSGQQEASQGAHLSGVHDPERVNRALDGPHQLDRAFPQLRPQVASLPQPDAMFSRA